MGKHVEDIKIKKGQLWVCTNFPNRSFFVIGKGRTRDWFGQGQDGNTHGMFAKDILKHYRLVK